MVNELILKRYKLVARIYFLMLFLSFIIALGYVTEYSQPVLRNIYDANYNAVAEPFLNLLQRRADVLFWLGLWSAAIYIVVFNAKLVKGKVMGIVTLVSRLTLALLSLVFAICALVFSLELLPIFKSDILPICTSENLGKNFFPTAFTFYFTIVFAVVLILVVVLFAYATVLFYLRRRKL